LVKVSTNTAKKSTPILSIYFLFTRAEAADGGGRIPSIASKNLRFAESQAKGFGVTTSFSIRDLATEEIADAISPPGPNEQDRDRDNGRV